MSISAVGKCQQGMKLEFTPQGGIFCVEPTLGIKAAPLITCPEGQQPKQYPDGSWACSFKTATRLSAAIQNVEGKAENLALRIDNMITTLSEEPGNTDLKAKLAAAAVEGEKILGAATGSVALELQKAMGRAYAYLETSMTDIADIVDETANEVVDAGQMVIERPFYKNPLFVIAALGLGAYILWR